MRAPSPGTARRYRRERQLLKVRNSRGPIRPARTTHGRQAVVQARPEADKKGSEVRFVAEGITIVVGVLAIAGYLGFNIKKYLQLHRNANKPSPKKEGEGSEKWDGS